eukprot:s57_g15.t2
MEECPIRTRLNREVLGSLGTLQHPNLEDRGGNGGIPNKHLGQPSILVRSHFAALVAAHATGGAVFVDSKSAYYSVVRDALIASRREESDGTLWARASALFPLQADRATFVRSIKQGDLLAAFQLPLYLVQYLEAQLGTTWYAMSAPASTTFVAGSGTAPGSPVADLFFGFLYSRFLIQIEEALLGEGHCVRLNPSDPKDSVAPTWADDTALLIGPLRPDRLLPALAGTAFKHYTHLGTVISHNGSEEPNLQHRAALLRQLFKPLRSRLLYNRWLTQQEKVRLISERVLLRFLYGAGFWAPRTVAERELTLGPIRTTYRQSFRPITGTSSAGFSNQEVASFLGLPTAEELLHQARAAAFTEVCDTGSAAVHALLRRDGTWLGLAWDSFRTVLGEHVPVGLCTSDPPALAELLALLPGGADQARQLCKRYLKAQCANRAPPPPLAARDAAASEMPKIVEVWR